VASLLVGLAWTADVAFRLLSGTRLLSLYHVALPVVLVLALRRVGYDARGYWLQSAIAIVAVAAGRIFGPAANINYAYVDPLLKRTWGGPLTHVAVVAGFLVLLVYPLTHVLLARLCPRPRP
jgi:hypothetical protein